MNLRLKNKAYKNGSLKPRLKYYCDSKEPPQGRASLNAYIHQILFKIDVFYLKVLILQTYEALRKLSLSCLMNLNALVV